MVLALHARGIPTDCFALGADRPIERDGVLWRPTDRPLEATGVTVLDSYVLPQAEQQRLADVGALVVMHEGSRPQNAALTVDTTLPPDEVATHLHGLAFTCLRPMFWGAERGTLSDVVRTVLVTMGAADCAGVTTSISELVRETAPEACVRVIRGPHAAFDPPAGIETVDAPPNLLALLLAADVVVCSAGQTSLEAAMTGTPSVTVTTADNQAPNAGLLAQLGISRSVAADDVTALRYALTGVLSDSGLRRRMGENGRKHVDGFGALRVAFKIAELVE